MTWNEMAEKQNETIAELKARLIVIEFMLEDVFKMQEAQDKMNGRLNYSMEVFDPGFEWDNVGKYEN